MADAVLHVKVDPSGAVVGSTAAAVSLDKLSAAAARSNAATNMLTSAFTSSNVAARNVEVGLRSMLREQTGLARAYAAGSDAVKQYNLQLKIESVLAEAGVAANTMRGRAIAAQVAQLDQLIAANEAAALAQREADAAAGKMGGGLSGLMGKVFGVAAALALLKSTATDFAHAALEAEDAERRLASAVERRGASFKVSTGELVKMSTRLESVTRFEDDAIQKATAILLRFDEIDGSNIDAVTRATLDFAEATGQDAASAATAFGKALLVPGEAMRALKEVGVTLTEQQQMMVDAWNSTGQGAKSVSLLVGMLNDKIGGEAEASAKTGAGGIDQFTAALGNLKELLGAALIPDLSFLTFSIRATTFAMAAAAKGDSPAESIMLYVDALKEFGSQEATAAQLATSLKLIGDNGRHMKDSGPWVPPKTKEEIEAAKRAAEEYQAKLQAIIDKADPFGAKQRQIAADVALLKEAFKVFNVPLSEQLGMMAQITGDWSAVGGEIEDVKIELLEATSALEEWKKANAGKELKSPKNEGTLTIEHVEIPKTASEQALADLKSNLEQSVTGAFSYGIAAFLSGSKDAAEQFGDALKGAFINAVSEYLSRMLAALAKELAVRLANAAKEAAARNAGAAGGGGGGVGFLRSLFGGGGGAGTGLSSGTVAIGAWVAIAAAAVAILKHQSDRANAVRYQTTVQYNTGSNNIGFGGKLMETGGKIADAFKALLDEVQSATGSLLEGAHKAVIAVRNDKKRFQALVDGVLVGTFKTVDEAIVAAMKRLFSAENLKNQMDPIVQQVIDNFDAKKGPQAFADAVRSVSEIVDGLSGLTEIELQLRDLPAQSEQLASKLHEMGVAMSDAQSVAARWTVQQLQSIRDQITGHQATAAEQLAERQRQATYFNAQLAVSKANMAMKKAEIEHDIEVLKARVGITNTKYELDKWQLEAERDFAQQSADIAQYEVDVRYAAGQASITLLQAQLEAINQAMAALEQIRPINMGEIHLPRGHGGGGGNVNVDSGPSEAEQRARSFAEFIEQMRLDGLSNYQRALAELTAAFAAQAQAAGEAAGGEKALIAARVAATARLRENLIDQMGLPMEAVRDRFAQMQQQAADFYASNVELQRQFDAGEISIEEFTAAVQRSQQIQRELRNQALSDVASMALYFTDALGFDEESAQIRQVLAQLEWEFKLAEFKLAVEQYYLMKRLTDEQYAYLNDLIDRATNAGPPPPPPPPPPPRDQGSGGNDARDEALNNLTRALDRLRSIVQTYTDFLRGLQTSESSPYSIEQQYNTAQAEYQRLLALAQAGNLDAIEALPNAAQTYLDLAAQMFGTASAGYAQIFEGINTDMSDILGGVQSILDSVPTQFRPMEERLDTIAEILQNMYLLQGGTAGTGGGANPHAGLVYYGPEWGWHPMGWSPGGNTPPSTGNFAANAASPSLTNANGVGQPLAETNRHLQVIAAQQARAAKQQASDRYRKPKLSYAGYAGGRSAGERRS